jgi:NADH:ubiquinone reductase (H+-translocating)
MNKEHVVVLGGGYAGALAAVRLAGRARRRAKVTLVDPKPHFVQRLRLHQVAVGQKVAEPSYRKLLGRRVEIVEGWAQHIDTERGRVVVSGAAGVGELPFDRLIYAVGSTVDRSGTPGVAEHAYTLADVAAARRLNHVLHYSSRARELTVVGGGMTGLEMASELATQFPERPVKLVTAGQLGGWLSERAREYLAATLSRQAVEVIEAVRVERVEPDRLLLADGAELPSGLTIWCGGFRASPLAANSGLETDGLDRLLVDRTLRSISHPQIIGAGDSAATPAFVAGRPLRMACQVAGPMGGHAAETALAELKGREPKALHFGYLHQPISLGRKDGLIQFVDRADRPKDSMLTGRSAAIYKELISSGPIPSMKLERLLPGATKWPFKEPKGEPAELLAPASS